MHRYAIDVEANGLLGTVDTIWCLVAKNIDTQVVHKFTQDQVNNGEVYRFLTTCKVIVGQNFLGYDVPLLEKVLGYKFRSDQLILDTYILSQMLEPDRKRHPLTKGKKGPHSLENMGNWLGRHKPEHEDWTQYSEEMLHRCSEDVEITCLEFTRLNRKARLFDKDSRWIKPYKIEAGFQLCVNKQVERGILIDQDKLEKNIQFFTDEIQRVDDLVIPQLPQKLHIHESKKQGIIGWNKKPFKGDGTLNQYTTTWCVDNNISDTTIIGGPFTRISFSDFDLGSLKDVKEYLLSKGWKPLKWNYKEDPATGQKIRTSAKIDQEDEFLGVQGDVGKQVAKRLICRHRLSQLQGFKDKLRPDGRLTSVITGITPTVRCKHAIVVNIPGADAAYGQKMREIFIAPKGYKLVGCDAASCQLRNLCHHMGDDKYTEAVINGDKDKGTDIHTLNMQAAGLNNRTDAKRFIYGFLFGAGDEKTGLIIGKGRLAGKAIKSQFLSTLPKLKALIDGVTRQFNTYKYIHGLDGRLIYPRSPHEALCYQLQSDEAIMMKVATIYLHQWIEKEGLDAHMVSHMHDEYNFEVRGKHTAMFSKLAEKAITKAGEWLNMNVPMAGEACIGDTWWEIH
jgi:DNA polymerase I-like protein with 3'-5' exonuclease and polymerase domains